MDNLVALCGAHHRSAHVGALIIRGTYATGLTFEHADGRAYGSPSVSPAKAAVLATVLELLVAMGFKHREAQTMIDRIRTHVGAEASVEDALEAALHSAPTPPAARTSRPPDHASSSASRAERRIPSPPERARERPLPA